MGFFGDILGFLATPFTAAAGWAWDTVVGGITDWIARGVMALMMALWNFMDTASSPNPDAEWFSGSGSTPFNIAFQIGIVMASILVLLGIIRGVFAGSPGAVAQTVGRDLPIAAFAAASTIGLAKVAIDLADGISDYVWDQTRQDAENALGGLIEVMMALNSGSLGFAAPLLGLFLIFVMLFMWIVLFIRESLIYLVIIYAVAFGFPSMLFPPLRDTSKKVLELLVALIIAKPVMVLAMSVGLSALGGVGATGQPGDGVGDNIAKELGTMIVGVVVFGLAAFMPYLTWKLMPLVAVAVVAQGVASSPMRGVTQAAQLQYYGTNAMKRMTGQRGGGTGAAGDSASGVGNGGAQAEAIGRRWTVRRCRAERDGQRPRGWDGWRCSGWRCSRRWICGWDCCCVARRGSGSACGGCGCCGESGRRCRQERSDGNNGDRDEAVGVSVECSTSVWWFGA